MRSKSVIGMFILILLLGLSAGMTGAVSGSDAGDQRPQFVEGELLVKLKPDVSPYRLRQLNRQFHSRTLRHFRLIDVYQLQLPPSLSVTQAIPAFQGNPYVEYAIPNQIYYLDDTFPNDPSFGELWGMHNTGQTGGVSDADIDAPEAWDLTTGNSSVVIAVIDSGLDMDHEDIAGNVWVNPGEIPGNGVDDDGNGYVDDVNGWDFSSNDNNPSPAGGACAGHGTHTAGTIGARGNNGVGVSGVNWDIQIMPLKAFSTSLFLLCSADDADLLAAVEYHTMMGVRISSNSWGGGGYSQAMFDAIRASNSLFVAAAGNGGLDGIGDNNDNSAHYPSSYQLDNIVAVAATNHNDARASFSNFGSNSVDIGAPGVDIRSTVINGYNTLSGTSMATPHVAGVAGLLLSQDPGLTNNEMKWRILTGADPIALQAVSGGRLNAYNALAFGLAPMAVTVDVVPLGSTSVRAGDIVAAEITATNNDVVAHTFDGSAYVRLPDGRERSMGQATRTINPGQSLSITLSDRVPGSAPAGVDFTVFAQVQTPVSFDEDYVQYTIVP